MKNKSLIVLGIVATMVIGLGSLASVQGSDILVEILGETVVLDDPSDFLLRRCDPDFPSIPCSLPPSTQPPPSTLPGYFDIESASITQINRGLVELVIKVHEPIPAVPYISPGTPYGFVSYIWQFQGGCVEPKTGNKDSISVVWTYWEDDQIWEWRAYWYVITGCTPRAIKRGHRVPFKFIGDGVRVWVPLRDLLTAIDPVPGYLEWHAAVRRIPFIYHPEGYPNFPNTAAVDYAPDVLEFLPCTPPPDPQDPCAWIPEDFAHWQPR